MSAVHADLRGAAGSVGELVLPGDPPYDQARRVWNLAIDRRPAAIARCRDAADVVAALRIAREHGLEVAVRGGGHGFTGFATTDGGLVIDLGPMKRLAIDAERRTATAGPGLTWGELTDAAGERGLAPVGGHVSNVGIAGLTLGGGNGWFSRVFGLACDNLLAAEVVTAAGERVRASAEENPDLLWGLRGGGGNFGIVVEFTYRLHPVSRLVGGLVLHRIGDAADVLGFLADFGSAAPPELNVAAALMTAPPAPFVPADLVGAPILLLNGAYIGPVADGEEALAPMRGFGRPLADLVGPTTFVDLQHSFDASGGSTCSHMRSHLVGPLADGLIGALVDGANRLTSPGSAVILVPMGGATRAVARNATAFWHRDAEYCVEIGAAWSDPAADPRPHRAWADELWTATRPWALGVEVNHLGDEGPARIREAYGDNYPRLAELKRAWDPENVFRLNQNIAPAPPVIATTDT